MESSILKKYINIVVGVVVVLVGIAIYVIFTQKNVTNDEVTQSLQTAEESFNSGNVNLSIAELEDLLLKNISDEYRFNVLVALASAYAQKGSLEFKELEYGQKAVELIQQSMNISPNNSNAYRVMAYAYEIMQNYPASIAAYEKAIALDPNNAMAHSGAGHAYDLIGDETKATSHLKEAVRIDETLDHALLNLARLYYKQGKMSESDMYAQKVIDVSSNTRFLSEATNIKGAIAFEAGDMESALTFFTEASTIDPTLAHNYLSLARTKMQALLTFGLSDEEINGIAMQSLSFVEQAITLNPTLAAAYIEKGRILVILNKRDEARMAFNTAAEAVKKDITLSAPEKESLAQFIADSILNNNL